MTPESKPTARNPMVVLVVLALGLFMTLLDLTIVNVAIPTMSTGLSATLDQILWVLNAYSLAYAVLLITMGRMGDIFGPKTLFVVGITVFTIASALSGISQSPLQLILARSAQGVGAAILAPQGLPIMLTIFPPDKRGGVFAVFGIVAGLAVVAGPTVGGFLTTNFGWRWIFFVNLPVGIAVLAAAVLVIPDLRPGRRHRLDLPGILLATAGLFGIVFGLIEGQRYDWGTVFSFVTIPMIIAAGALLLLAFLLYQARRQDQEPLLHFAVFKDRNFTLMTVVLAAMGFSIVGYYLPITIYLQSVLGLSALDAGLTTAAQPVTMMIVSGVAGSIVQRVGGKYLLIPGLTLLAIGTTWIALAAQPTSSRWVFLPGLIVSGFGLGLTWGPIYSLATRDLKPELAGVASGVLNTIQELGAVIASAAVGALLQSRLATELHDQAVQRAAELPAPARDHFVSGFSGAARSGFEVGAGQTGTAANAAGIPPQLAQQIGRVAREVFTSAFVTAMRPALFLTVGVVVVAAVLCFAIRQRPRATAADAAEVAAVA